MRAESNHGLDCEAHPGLCLADSLVLGVMRHVGRAVEELVDTVAAVGLHDAAVGGLCNLLDGVAVVSEERSGLDELDRFLETVASGLDYAHAVGVLVCLADVVGFVQIAVKASVVESNIDVEDVAVL